MKVTLGRAFGCSAVTPLSLYDGRRDFGLAARRRFGRDRMGRLKSLSSRLSSPRSRLTYLPGDRQAFDRKRDEQAWRRWYKTARWQKLRMDVLIRDLFTCQRCGHIEADTSQLVADHRKPHRGVEALFWDILNLWTLCKPCHDGWKQRLEARDL
jgi:hypothetical protein